MAAGSQLIGHTLGHYHILERIGAGGMGVVYRAHDERLDRDVAIKVLAVGTLADDAARKRFRKEALALAHLNHPNIATVYKFNSQNGEDYLVTEYIPGLALDAKLAAGTLPEKEVVGLGSDGSVLAFSSLDWPHTIAAIPNRLAGGLIVDTSPSLQR